MDEIFDNDEREDHWTEDSITQMNNVNDEPVPDKSKEIDYNLNKKQLPSWLGVTF